MIISNGQPTDAVDQIMMMLFAMARPMEKEDQFGSIVRNGIGVGKHQIIKKVVNHVTTTLKDTTIVINNKIVYHKIKYYMFQMI